MTEDILDRLLELRRRRMWSQSEMASHLDLTEEAYRALEKGRTIRLEWDTIIRLLMILSGTGLSWNWFFFGTEQLQDPARTDPRFADNSRPTAGVTSPNSRLPSTPTPPADDSRGAATTVHPETGIPVLTLSGLGQSLNLKTSNLSVRGAPRLQVDPPIASAVLGIRIEGDALAPEYRNGDVVVCRAGSPDANRPGFLLLCDRECLLCLWHAESPDTIRLIPSDPEQPVRTVARTEVVAVYAPLRRVPREMLMDSFTS